MEVGELKLPKPVFSDVLIKNPITQELSESIDKEISMLPKEDRDKYLQEKIPELWSSVEIISVGPDCRMIKPGEKAILDSNGVLNSGLYVLNSGYILFSERLIKAIW
jgi:hypothetical protein